MKKYVPILLLCAMPALFNSCRNYIRGSGEPTMATRNVEPFNSLELNLDADVVITDSMDQSFMISAQENLMPVIDARVKSKKLIISSDKHIMDSKPIILYISVNRLNALELNGSGNIRSSNTIKTGTIQLEINGSGNMDMDIICDHLKADVSGSGNLQIRGNSNSSAMDISGSGVIEAMEHRTGDCQASVSGSGQARIFPSGVLKASVTGSGTIQYKGSPSNILPSVSGSGSIEKSE